MDKSKPEKSKADFFTAIKNNSKAQEKIRQYEQTASLGDDNSIDEQLRNELLLQRQKDKEDADKSAHSGPK